MCSTSRIVFASCHVLSASSPATISRMTFLILIIILCVCVCVLNFMWWFDEMKPCTRLSLCPSTQIAHTRTRTYKTFSKLDRAHSLQQLQRAGSGHTSTHVKLSWKKFKNPIGMQFIIPYDMVYSALCTSSFMLICRTSLEICLTNGSCAHFRRLKFAEENGSMNILFADQQTARTVWLFWGLHCIYRVVLSEYKHTWVTHAIFTL